MVLNRGDVKIALQNYHHYIGKSAQYEIEIDSLFERLKGVKGGIVKMPDQSIDKHRALMGKLSLIEKKDKVEALKISCDYYVDLANRFIDWMKEPEKTIVRWRYFEQIPVKDIAKMVSYTERQILNIINKQIELFVKESEENEHE